MPYKRDWGKDRPLVERDPMVLRRIVCPVCGVSYIWHGWSRRSHERGRVHQEALRRQKSEERGAIHVNKTEEGERS